MRQTVVGVFETSDEARRAQAALLDAQFQPASIRVSAGGRSDEAGAGMAYPSNAGIGGDFLSGPPASPVPATLPATSPVTPRTAHAHTGHEGPLERVTEFFKDLFSPEESHEEIAHYEEAVRRGGTLVAVDVEDDLEETLASDILIRAGAYDLEERARTWRQRDYAAEEGAVPASVAVPPRASRAPAMPGNVTSMNPLDPTGYAASGSDMPDAGMTEADRMEWELREAARLEADRIEARRQETDHLQANRLQADRLQADRFETRRFEADHPEANRLDTGRLEVNRLEADRLEARRFEADYLEAGRRESALREARSAVAADREADRRQAERLEAERVRARSQRPGDFGKAVVSSREADHLLGTGEPGEETFIDDAGFASRSAEMNAASSEPLAQPRSQMCRNVRVYSRQADEAAVRHATAACDEDPMAPSVARNLPLRETGAMGGSALHSETAAPMRDPQGVREREWEARERDDVGAGSSMAGSAMMPRSDTPTRRDRVVREETLSPELMPDEWSAMETTQVVSPGPASSPQASRTRRGVDDLAEREARMRDETLTDYEAMDERAQRVDPLAPAFTAPTSTARRRTLDDGAPLVAEPYDDDDRRYAEGADNGYGTEAGGFVDTRDPSPLRSHEGSEWAHIKQVVRDAWHRMTGHHH
jgi:hypothetical protein